MPHLLKIHTYWIIENIEFRVGFLFLLLFFLVVFANLFDAIHIRRVDYLNLDATKLGDDGIDVVGIINPFWQMLIQIFKSDITLLFCELNQLTDFILNQLRYIERPRRRGCEKQRLGRLGFLGDLLASESGFFVESRFLRKLAHFG